MPQRQTHVWNSTEARELMRYAISTHKTIFGFELGNEQCGVFTAAETATNFAQLSALLEELYTDATTRPRILGPDPWGFHEPFPESDVNTVSERWHEEEKGTDQHLALTSSTRRHLDGEERLQFIVDFYGNCTKLGVHLHALTHHEYIDVPQNPVSPINGNATLLDFTARIAAHVNHTLASIKAPEVQIWAGEIGPHNGGSIPCKNGGRWANWGSTFWYLDAMASKAANGYSVFCRQDFIGIDYGMLDCASHAPLPDFYGGILWSKLMGQKVLHVSGSTPAAGRSVRAYAHCAANITGAVTVLLLNIDANATATVNLGKLGSKTTRQRKEWHLVGVNGTDAAFAALNDVTLQYSVDSSSGEALLPALSGRMVLRAGEDDVVELAPASIVFVQVSGGAAAAALCT